jgi:hypothetical protein
MPILSVVSLAFASGWTVVWDAQQRTLGNRSQKRPNRGIVSECLADVREPVHISRSEHEAAAELKRILPQLMLMMAAGSGALSRYGVFASQEMQEVRGLQVGHAITLPLFVDQKRKGNARFFTKHPCIIAVA